MKPKALDLASLGVFLCTVLLTVVVVKREFFPKSPASSPERRIKPRQDLTLVGRTLGSDTAAVVIVEFSDFQCPYCARAQPTIDSLLRRYPGQVKVVFRHLPLETLHALAWSAAEASECAAEQGKFAEYHNLLFQLRDSLAQLSFPSLAERAGVSDLKAFGGCLEEERHSFAVRRDVLLARDLELRGTPAFIIGETLYEGVPPFKWFEQRVSKALRDKKAE